MFFQQLSVSVLRWCFGGLPSERRISDISALATLLNIVVPFGRRWHTTPSLVPTSSEDPLHLASVSLMFLFLSLSLYSMFSFHMDNFGICCLLSFHGVGLTYCFAYTGFSLFSDIAIIPYNVGFSLFCIPCLPVTQLPWAYYDTMRSTAV